MNKVYSQEEDIEGNMLISFFHQKDQPCGLQRRLFLEKKHNPRTAEERGWLFYLLFFDWCVELTVLFRTILYLYSQVLLLS